MPTQPDAATPPGFDLPPRESGRHGMRRNGQVFPGYTRAGYTAAHAAAPARSPVAAAKVAGAHAVQKAVLGVGA